MGKCGNNLMKDDYFKIMTRMICKIKHESAMLFKTME